MDDAIIIDELQSSEEILGAFPVMNQLRSHLDEPMFLALVTEAKERDMYRLFALHHQKEIVAVVGFKPMITLYYGRFIWVCDLVTTQQKRSKGYGEKLLIFVQDWAKKMDMKVLHCHPEYNVNMRTIFTKGKWVLKR